MKMIKAVIFDLDNTLVDFMTMKKQAIEAAISAMIDAGLKIPPEEAKQRIDRIYAEKGIEYQQVFDDFLREIYGRIDIKFYLLGLSHTGEHEKLLLFLILMFI